jgi:radical SAM protein with 4Fe4S-binding SPASM domain
MLLFHFPVFSRLVGYAKTLSPARVLNLLKLVTGFFLSRLLRRPKIKGHPFALSVEPSGYCQLQCPECPTGAAVLTRPKGLLNLDLFDKILTETAPYLIYLNLYFQGEPLIHPQIATMVAKAAQKNIYTHISTNGMLLDKRMCFDRKGGDADAVKNGVLRMIQARSELKQTNPHIVVQFLAFRHNMHELEQLKQWCGQAGVDKLKIKSAQLNDFGDGSIQPAKSKTRYKTTNRASYNLKGKAYNYCWRQWSSAVITRDGSVAPCCYDKDLAFNFGNISYLTLNDIWRGTDNRNFRKAILTQRSNIAMCNNCPEGRQPLL